MKCPRGCEGELRPLTLSQLSNAVIRLCPECEGAWYPHGALSAVGDASADLIEGTDLSVSLVADKLEKVDLEATVECPECHQTMRRFSYSLAPEVKIDECFEHGTWLDDGELGAILESVAASREDMEKYRQAIADMRQRMDMDGIAKGSSALNPFAATLRLLNWMFSSRSRA
jgi:Zn-finger nucleic acid-binding protein